MRRRLRLVLAAAFAVLAGSTAVPTVVAADPSTNALEPLVVKHSGKCLDVRGGPQATQDGALIEQWHCTTASNQNWTMQDAGNGQIRLVAQNSGKCVQPIGGGTANSTGLEQRACGSAATQLWTRQNTAIAGEYWALPSRYPAKSPYGGLNQIWGRSINWSPTTDMHWVGGNWRDLNPAEGTYRWDRIESISGSSTYSLDQLGAVGKNALIWTIVGTVDNTDNWRAPQWILNKCAAAGQPITVINNGSEPWGLALWEPCPRAEVKRFITEMFSRYRNDARVKHAYATTLSAGEFWMPPNVYNDAASKGLTPEILRTYAKDIIDAWVTAVGVKKVIWTHGGTWDLPGDAGSAETDWVRDYALQTLGTQLREGNAESVSAHLSQQSIGQSLEVVQPTPIGAQPPQVHNYLTAKTIHEMGREGMAFYGNEFEIANLAGVFGNYDYYRLAVLNMLRKGQNWAIFPHDLRTGTSDAANPVRGVARLLPPERGSPHRRVARCLGHAADVLRRLFQRHPPIPQL